MAATMLHWWAPLSLLKLQVLLRKESLQRGHVSSPRMFKSWERSSVQATCAGVFSFVFRISLLVSSCVHFSFFSLPLSLLHTPSERKQSIPYKQCEFNVTKHSEEGAGWKSQSYINALWDLWGEKAAVGGHSISARHIFVEVFAGSILGACSHQWLNWNIYRFPLNSLRRTTAPSKRNHHDSFRGFFSFFLVAGRCPTGVARSQQSWASSRCRAVTSSLHLCVLTFFRDWLWILSLFSCAPAPRWAPLSYQPDQLRQRVCFGSTLRVEQSSSLIVSSSRPDIPREFTFFFFSRQNMKGSHFAASFVRTKGSGRFLLQRFLVAGGYCEVLLFFLTVETLQGTRSAKI